MKFPNNFYQKNVLFSSIALDCASGIGSYSRGDEIENNYLENMDAMKNLLERGIKIYGKGKEGSSFFDIKEKKDLKCLTFLSEGISDFSIRNRFEELSNFLEKIINKEPIDKSLLIKEIKNFSDYGDWIGKDKRGPNYVDTILDMED